MFSSKKPSRMPTPGEAPPGRNAPIRVSASHFVNGSTMYPPWLEMELALFGMGCFWGAEKKFWQLSGVHTTAVGYAGGTTLNPNYREVCSGFTGHNEVVQVVYDPAKISYRSLLSTFWQSHNPTQGMRQGHDIGTQYRSGIYVHSAAQRSEAEISKAEYQARLREAGYGLITTEILDAPEFYYAEDYHQQYLAKNPGGYCGLGGTGVSDGRSCKTPTEIANELETA